jgi:3'-phosphoadenosine 5'-phosphosulfate (PAPS) 3'-phosphatase
MPPTTLPSNPEMAAMVGAARAAVRRAAVIATRVRARVLATDGEGATKTKIAKADTSPVTIADYAAQVAVSASLMNSLGYGGAAAGIAVSRGPFRLMGEEDASTLRGAGDALLGSVVAALNEGWPRADAAGGVWTGDEVLSYLSRGGFEGEEPGSAGAGYWILDPIDGTKVSGRREVCLSVVGERTGVHSLAPSLSLRVPSHAPPPLFPFLDNRATCVAGSTPSASPSSTLGAPSSA